MMKKKLRREVWSLEAIWTLRQGPVLGKLGKPWKTWPRPLLGLDYPNPNVRDENGPSHPSHPRFRPVPGLLRYIRVIMSPHSAE